MVNLMDICPKNVSLSLNQMKDIIQKEKDEDMESRHIDALLRYRQHHIFGSNEEALEYLVANIGDAINWYGRTLTFQPDDGKFISYDSDESKVYTKEQLLLDVELLRKKLNKTYKNVGHQDLLKDRFGCMIYVSI